MLLILNLQSTSSALAFAHSLCVNETQSDLSRSVCAGVRARASRALTSERLCRNILALLHNWIRNVTDYICE